MSDKEKDSEATLEWLKLKTDKGQKPDYVLRGEMENIGNKFVRKFGENPFVPIGKFFYRLMISNLEKLRNVLIQNLCVIQH